MLAPSKGAESTATSLQILWLPLVSQTETGNSQILAYELRWDANSGTTNIRLYEGLTLDYTVESLQAGLDYKFKVRALNIYGFGDYSSTVTLRPDSAPAMMSSVSTSLSYPTVTIAFSEPFNNGAQITSYQVQIYSYTETQFVEDVSVCDGSSMLLHCNVPMQILISQYGYSQGQLVVARVRAINELGPGYYSSQNSAGVIVQTEPTFMNAPEVLDETASDESILVKWSPIVTDLHTGASPITSYSLEWDQGTGEWQTVHGLTEDSLVLYYTQSANVLPGVSTMFRLRAKNQHGWGPYSQATSSVPSNVPAQMVAATLVIENVYVLISWTAPENRGAQIDHYRVLLLHKDATTWLESNYCLWSDESLVSDLQCYVPMNELTGPRFELPYNRFITVKVQAHNLKGWGPLSESNLASVTAETVPAQMESPWDGLLTSQT